AVDVLRDDDQLVGEVVELFRLALLEPGDRGQRVAYSDRIDIREQRSGRRSDLGIGIDLEAVPHVARPDRLAVMPPRPRIEREGDRQRVAGPGPALGE